MSNQRPDPTALTQTVRGHCARCDEAFIAPLRGKPPHSATRYCFPSYWRTGEERLCDECFVDTAQLAIAAGGEDL